MCRPVYADLSQGYYYVHPDDQTQPFEICESWHTKTRRRLVKGMLAKLCFDISWLLDYFSSWEIRRLISFCPCYWDMLRLGRLCMHLRVSRVNRVATRTLRGKVNNNKAESFFRLNLSVYIDLDNRERAKARDKKQRRSFSRWKKNIKILYRGWENEKC